MRLLSRLSHRSGGGASGCWGEEVPTDDHYRIDIELIQSRKSKQNFFE